LTAGVDEAGRGPLAGPVVAAAVILAPGTRLPGLGDSKALTEADRLRLRDLILARAEAWAIGMASPATIDRINILQATFAAMHEALSGLPLTPELILVDGNRFLPFAVNGQAIPHRCIVRGDATERAISAASILAKTTRDDIMLMLHREYPKYGWHRNKGYPTAEHRAAIAIHGLTPHHRRTFRWQGPATLF
jgi:ribonuclease HII